LNVLPVRLKLLANTALLLALAGRCWKQLWSRIDTKDTTHG
jgi:hypothetical protein